MQHWIAGSLELFQRYGVVGLFILSFVEASFFPIPPYLLMIPMILANPRMGFAYAAVGVIGSVSGGFLGYAIGQRVGRPILSHLMKPSSLEKLESAFGRYGGWAIAIGGVTPIPYKIFTIAAGAFRVRILTFIPASVIARSIRFFAEATLLIFFGQAVARVLEDALGPTNLLIMVGLATAILIAHKLGFFRKTAPFFRNASERWTVWATPIRQRVEPIGHFGWYLLTGATLMAFGFLAFAKIVGELLERDLSHFDQTVGHWVTSFRVDWLNHVMIAITNIGSTGGIIGVALGLTILGIAFHRRALDIITLDLCTLGGWLLNEFLKSLFHRMRPPLPWLTTAPGFSFPSGHAMTSLALYGFIAYFVLRHTRWSFSRNLLVIAILLLPILIGTSRVYLGVHYPSDVVGGWMISAAWVGMCVLGREMLRKENRIL